MLYQALTNRFQVAYINNLSCVWYRNLRFGLWLSQKIHGDRAHNNFKAEHGSTQEYGPLAPSECGEFWYRWLPIDRHFIDYADVTPAAVSQIQAEILGASAYLRRPLLFKNLNIGQRLRLISKAFPNARIIFVRRDPRFVVKSIINAREKLGIGAHQWWSVMPPNVNELLPLPEAEMCVAQVHYLEKQIEVDLKLFPAENVRELHYQELNNDSIDSLGAWIGLAPRPDSASPEFIKDDLEKFPESELKRLTRLLERYPFKKELFI
ncbi:MAG: sulfotransferase [Alteromonadaceae bacterium]|nr:sulfotransferase [Alteromonadaceae bacterium]